MERCVRAVIGDGQNAVYILIAGIKTLVDNKMGKFAFVNPITTCKESKGFDDTIGNDRE